MSEKSGDKYVNIEFENGLGRVEGPLMPLPNGEEIFIVGQVAICSHLGKIHYSSVGGGATPSGNPYNSRESPYWRKRFFTCPFILPKDSEKSTIENFSPPLQDALKIFRPPFAGR